MGSESNEYRIEDFIEVVYRDVFEVAVDECEQDFEDPPGSEPDKRLFALHQWYMSLDGEGRRMLREMMREVSFSAVFGMLALMDNVRPISEGYETEMRVYAEGPRKTLQLGVSSELHELFRERVYGHMD